MFTSAYLTFVKPDSDHRFANASIIELLSSGLILFLPTRCKDLKILKRCLCPVGYTVYDTTNVTVFDTNYVTIVDTNYISVTDTLIINVALTGLNPPNNLNTLKVYPNPTKNIIYIHTGKNYSLMADYKIRIINSQGYSIFESKITEQVFEIDVSTFSQTGLYFIELFDPVNQLIEVRKILLE